MGPGGWREHELWLEEELRWAGESGREPVQSRKDPATEGVGAALVRAWGSRLKTSDFILRTAGSDWNILSRRLASFEWYFRKVSSSCSCENGFEESRTGGQSPRPDFGGRRGRYLRSQDWGGCRLWQVVGDGGLDDSSISVSGCWVSTEVVQPEE